MIHSSVWWVLTWVSLVCGPSLSVKEQMISAGAYHFGGSYLDCKTGEDNFEYGAGVNVDHFIVYYSSESLYAKYQNLNPYEKAHSRIISGEEWVVSPLIVPKQSLVKK